MSKSSELDAAVGELSLTKRLHCLAYDAVSIMQEKNQIQSSQIREGQVVSVGAEAVQEAGESNF